MAESIVSFLIDRNTLEGEFPWSAGGFTVNGKKPERKDGVLEIRMKNGILSCMEEEGKILWHYAPSHPGNFGEKAVIAPKSRHLVAVARKVPFLVPQETSDPASGLCPSCVHALPPENGESSCSVHGKTVSPVWICQEHEKDSGTFPFRMDPSLYSGFGRVSCTVENHGKDFSLLFGNAVLAVKDGIPYVNDIPFEDEESRFSSFTLQKKDGKWIVSWQRTPKTREGQGAVLVFDLHGLDGSIRVDDAFIMVNDGNAMTDSGMTVENVEGKWRVFTEKDKFSFMVSNANGTVNGQVKDGGIILEPNEKEDILSGEFQLSFNTQTRFSINNKPARQNVDGELYFVLAEGLLVLSGSGRERGYSFFPGQKYEKKSFARRIDLVASYPDGSSERIENISIQKSILPGVVMEAE